jgi:membrane associated rhomboid family serine protease
LTKGLKHLFKSFRFPMQFCLLIWFIFWIQIVLKINLAHLGIIPRSEAGLPGILFAPLLHGSMVHLFSNTVPLLILGTTIFFFYPRAAYRIFFLSWFATNLLVWIFARPSVHLGASGLVYGIAFFLFFIGFFRKDFISILLSFVTVIFYGGIVYGIFPGEPYVSWESHMCGAIVGFCCAFYFRRRKS